MGAFLLSKLIAPFYRRFVLKIRKYFLYNADPCIDNIHSFHNGSSRLIFAFRHPSGMDPQVMFDLMATKLPRKAKRKKRKFKKRLHVSFVYGRAIAAFSGPLLKWVLRGIGAMPVLQGHFDKEGMLRIRKAITTGQFPLAIAPEGHVNYHNETPDELDNGLAVMAFWAADELSNKNENVKIIPVSLYYDYHCKSKNKCMKIIKQNAAIQGYTTNAATPREAVLSIYNTLLSDIAVWYGITPPYEMEISSKDFTHLLANAAFSRAEVLLKQEHKGNLNDRFYKIRKGVFDHIFENTDHHKGKSSKMNRTWAQKSARAGTIAKEHFEIGAILSKLDPQYIMEDDNNNRVIEYFLNWIDLAGRIRGGSLRNKPNLFPVDVHATFGSAISVTDKLEDYRKSRKKAITDITNHVQSAFRTGSRNPRERAE